MSELEFEGATETEAVAKAAAELGRGVDSIDYTVIDEGAEAVFGLGGRPARIRVSPEEEAVLPPPAEDPSPAAAPPDGKAKLEAALKCLTEIFDRMGLKASLRGEDGEEEISIFVADVEGETAVRDLFSTARPPLAPALQFLINKMVNRFPEGRKHVLVDVEGVVRPKRASRIKVIDGQEEEEFDPELVAMANLLAERARTCGKVISINPMRASERRAIHQTVVSIEGVKTVSSGEGLYRELHVLADARGGRGSGRRRRRGSGNGSNEDA